MNKIPLVWALAPAAEIDDPIIASYYDYSGSRAELAEVFQTLGLPWEWRLVTLANYRAIVDEILASPKGSVVLNLCDGDGIHGFPGPEVVALLEEKNIPFTGADSGFYSLSTSKVTMKQQFDRAGVPTADWEAIADDESNLPGIFKRLGSPLIVKPAVSGGHLGIGLKSVVRKTSEIKARLKDLSVGFHGWQTDAGGVLVERFIKGREFTVLLTGQYSDPATRKIYQPVERVFHSKLPEMERFCSFDRSWAFHEEEAAMPPDEGIYHYRPTGPEESVLLGDIAWRAYQAVKGTSYGRVDLRMDEATGQIFVLEVNSQPGLSGDPVAYSVGYILKATGVSFAQFIGGLLTAAGRKK